MEIKIESIEDKSGNKNHAVQSEVSKQPFDGDFIKLKQAIISKIHGLPWEEAIIIDNPGLQIPSLKGILDDTYSEYKSKPITLSRVLQAMREMDIFGGYIYHNGDTLRLSFGEIDDIYWKLLKEDKSTATLEDQSEETIETLKQIFLTKENV